MLRWTGRPVYKTKKRAGAKCPRVLFQYTLWLTISFTRARVAARVS